MICLCDKCFKEFPFLKNGDKCPDCNGSITELDDGLKNPMIKLWKNGFETFSSCSGHYDRKVFKPYVCFNIPNKQTEDKIVESVKKFNIENQTDIKIEFANYDIFKKFFPNENIEEKRKMCVYLSTTDNKEESRNNFLSYLKTITENWSQSNMESTNKIRFLLCFAIASSNVSQKKHKIKLIKECDDKLLENFYVKNKHLLQEFTLPELLAFLNIVGASTIVYQIIKRFNECNKLCNKSIRTSSHKLCILKCKVNKIKAQLSFMEKVECRKTKNPAKCEAYSVKLKQKLNKELADIQERIKKIK